MLEQAFKNIGGVLCKEAGCTTELDYTGQSCWLLFLKHLDGLETGKASEAALESRPCTHILRVKKSGRADAASANSNALSR